MHRIGNAGKVGQYHPIAPRAASVKAAQQALNLSSSGASPERPTNFGKCEFESRRFEQVLSIGSRPVCMTQVEAWSNGKTPTRFSSPLSGLCLCSLTARTPVS
jgi:hypothetical protein